MCNALAQRIWCHCMVHSMSISASHMLVFWMWMLTGHVMYSMTVLSICLIERFSKTVCRNFDIPTVDCFTTRINAHLPTFYPWRPEPRALVVDYFSVGWGNLELLYIFCLSSLMAQVLRKVCRDRARAVIIYPKWEVQPWWPQLTQMLRRTVLLPEDCLHHAVTGHGHRLKLTIYAGLIE